MKRAPRDPGAAYGAALARALTAEKALLRAFHRWEKTRRDLARREHALDRAQAALGE